MTRAIELMRELADRNVMPLDGDRAFHLAIVEACGNVVLSETVQGFWDSRRGPIFTRLGGYFETVKSWRSAIAEHEAIRDAIAAHDAEARAHRDACAHGQVAPALQRELAPRPTSCFPTTNGDKTMTTSVSP